MKFTIEFNEQQQIDKWMAEQKEVANPEAEPCIGGRWTYAFNPTSIGTAITVTDNYTGAKFSPEIDW